MKKKMVLLLMTMILIINTCVFAETPGKYSGEINPKYNSELFDVSNKLNSKPVKLNEKTFFIPDNRPSTLMKIRLEEKDNPKSVRSSGYVQYGYVYAFEDVATPQTMSCEVRLSSYVKAVYEYNVYRFLTAEDPSITAEGNSDYSCNPNSGNARISGTGGRYLNLDGAFNVETTIYPSAGVSYGVLGWSFNVSAGGEYHLRKWVRIKSEIDGNSVSVD